MNSGLQAYNEQNKLSQWVQIVSQCRDSGLSVRQWCQEHGVNISSYYKWHQKVYAMVQAQQEIQFAEVTPEQPVRPTGIAVTVRIVGAADPEVMLTDFTGADRVFIACGYTDLHRGIDGLASLVQQQFDLDPFTNTLFLFCGRRRDRIKALYWEGNGFALLYKRLESGSFQWPRKESEARSLTPQQYRWLMEGLSVDQPKAHNPINRLEIV